MALFQDANAGTDPSAASETPDAGAGADNGAATIAESSTATGELADTLSIVRDVVDESRGEGQTASPAEGGEEGKQPEDPNSPTPKEPDNVNYTDVPFHKHPRFQQILKERNSAQQDATRYQNVQTFLDQHGLDGNEAAEGLTIMALMKTNPVAAWEKLKPIVQDLLVAAGEVLPDDLKAMVQAGQMSQEAAIEVSRSRASVQSTQATMSFQQQQVARQRQMEHGNTLYSTAVSWENDRKAKDPNFEAKMPLVMEKLKVIQFDEGKPNTPQGVKEQLDRAYKAVVLPSARPASPRTATAARVPAMSGQPSGNAQPAPQTTLEIIQAEAAKRAV